MLILDPPLIKKAKRLRCFCLIMFKTVPDSWRWGKVKGRSNSPLNTEDMSCLLHFHLYPTPRSIWIIYILKDWKCNSLKHKLGFKVRFSSNFSIIRHFLSNRGRILPALTEKNKIKNCPYWGFNPQPLDHQSHTLPTVLSHYLVACVNH